MINFQLWLRYIHLHPKKKSTDENEELNRLRAKLLELHEIRDALNKEIRYTKDAINLLEKGEK